MSILERIAERGHFDIAIKGWRWWLRELRACIPPEIRRFFSDNQHVVRIDIEDSRFQFTYCSPKENRALLAVDRETASSEESRTRVREAISALPEAVSFHLYLAKDHVLCHRVVLPRIAENRLANVINFEVDRFTPFQRGQANIGYRKCDDQKDGEKLFVDLFIVRRDFLDQLLRDISSMGISVSAVYPADVDVGNEEFSLNLLGFDQRQAGVPPAHDRKRRLAIAALLAGLFAILYPPWQLVHIRDSLKASIEESRRDAEAASVKQNALANLLAAHDMLLELQRSRPGILQILQELTERVPEDTWVAGLDINGNSISLKGESDHASDLIEILENSALFQNVTFVSSITRNPLNDKDRYELRMEISGHE